MTARPSISASRPATSSTFQRRTRSFAVWLRHRAIDRPRLPAFGSPTCCASPIRCRSTSMSRRSSHRRSWWCCACSAGGATGPTGWSRSRPPAARRAFPLRCCPGTISRIRSWPVFAPFPPMPVTGSGNMASMAASPTARRCSVTRPLCLAGTSPGRSLHRCCAPASTGRARRHPISKDCDGIAGQTAGPWQRSSSIARCCRRRTWTSSMLWSTPLAAPS